MADTSFADSLNRLKESFLWAAAQGGNVQDCESLIEIGADINWRNQDGDTPLLVACRKGHTDTVNFLMAHGADSNIAGSDTLTPLHVCAKRGDHPTLNILLDGNTSTVIKTREGQTALDIAKSRGYEDIYSRLKQVRSTFNSARSSTQPIIISNSTRSELVPPIEPLTAPPATRILPVNRNNLLPELPAINASNTHINPSNTFPSSRRSSYDRIIMDPIATNRTESSDSYYRTSIIPRSETTDSIAKDSRNFQNKEVSTKNSLMDDKNNYSIMGLSAASYGVDEGTYALRKLLDQEKVTNKGLEEKLEAFHQQNVELIQELTEATKEISDLQEECNGLRLKNDKLNGKNSIINQLSMIECEKLERELKNTLDKIELRKANIIKEQSNESQKDQRLCVICQERDKSVVLLPCRHLCLCDPCSQHPLPQCPLCRETIAHKFSVFG